MTLMEKFLKSKISIKITEEDLKDLPALCKMLSSEKWASNESFDSPLIYDRVKLYHSIVIQKSSWSHRIHYTEYAIGFWTSTELVSIGEFIKPEESTIEINESDIDNVLRGT